MSRNYTPPASAYREYLDGELASENERSAHGMLTQIGRYGLLKFGALALGCPFETVRLLCQIQVGSLVEDVENWEAPSTPSLEEQGREAELMLNRSTSRAIGEFYAAGGSMEERERSELPFQISRDPSGYLHERSIPSSMPSQWPLKLNKESGLLRTMGHISRRHGLFSLWQGIGAGWTHDVLMDLGRATVEEALEGSQLIEEFHLPTTFISSIFEDEVIRPALIAGLAQGIVGTILSPIEMARLRLMAQSVWPLEQKYSGLLSALSTMRREETGWLGLFRHPFLTFSQYFLSPVLRILPVSLLNFHFGPDDDTSLPFSLAWLAVQNVVMCLPLLFTIPLETIRRRLLVQCLSKSVYRPYITRVRISDTPYSGVLNCLWRMLREEGPGSLYQGWTMQVAATTASFATTLLAELGDEDIDDDDSF
jgi:fusion and transport protein UGO1